MHLIKENYLQINYDSMKGMLLNWNFKDLHQIHNYYHHLMILISPRGKTNQGLLQQYYKRMKFGDLISFAYVNSSNTPKMMNWMEKTQLAGLQVSKLMDRITKDDLSVQAIDNLIHMAASYTIDNGSSNVVANFIFSDQERQKSDYYVKKIISLRQDGAFSYHCGLFNLQWYNKISFSNGIHFLNTETRDVFQVLSLYHTIINSAAVRFAKITIDCSNGQMMSYDTQIWQNSDFSRIQRTFYGPSINYQEDIIQFHVLDAFDDAEFDMVITLQLQLFSEQLVSNSKRMKISFQNERHCDKSLNLTNHEPVMTYQGVEIRSNPFSTSTFVRLMRSNYQDLSEIKQKLEVTCRAAKRISERTTTDRTAKPQDQRQKYRKKPLEYFYPNRNEQENQQFFI